MTYKTRNINSASNQYFMVDLVLFWCLLSFFFILLLLIVVLGFFVVETIFVLGVLDVTRVDVVAIFAVEVFFSVFETDVVVVAVIFCDETIFADNFVVKDVLLVVVATFEV